MLSLKSLKHVRISACVTVALQILTKGEVVDDWFQLRATHSRTDGAGTIRIKARYMVSIVVFYTVPLRQLFSIVSVMELITIYRSKTIKLFNFIY